MVYIISSPTITDILITLALPTLVELPRDQKKANLNKTETDSQIWHDCVL